MSDVGPEKIRRLILAECAEALLYFGLDPEELGDDFDLRLSGIVDSLGFLEIVVALQNDFGVEIDLSEVPGDQLTVLGPLARAVAAQVSERSSLEAGS